VRSKLTEGSRLQAAGRRPLLKPALFLACLLPLAHLTWRGLTDRLGADPIREIQIETGLWTLRLLAATLTITPVRRLSGWNGLVKYRRMLGLFTFFYASLHLTWWIGVDWFFDFRAMWEEIVKHKYILVGMATFLLMTPLAITSTKGWVRRLGGGRWARLHRLVYLCAIGGTVHYLWAVKKDTFYPLVYFTVFALLLGYRAYVWWGGRRRAIAGPHPEPQPVPR
jgi:sulfoxide reductase heme-binding subunit YedZ